MLKEYIKKVTGEDFDKKFPVPCPPKHAVRDYLTSSLTGLLDEIEKMMGEMHDPTYRFYVDLQTTQDALDANMNRIREEMRLSNFPPIVVDYSRQEGNGESLIDIENNK